jgi:hypothetical protein
VNRSEDFYKNSLSAEFWNLMILKWIADSDGIRHSKEVGKHVPDALEMKRALFLIGGTCWFLFALGFAAFLVRYIAQGAGLQFFGPPVASGSVLLGLVHVVGFAMAVVLCFAIGAGLCARGIVREDNKNKPDDITSSDSQRNFRK